MEAVVVGATPKINNNVLQKMKFVYQKKGTTNVRFGWYFKPFK